MYPQAPAGGLTVGHATPAPGVAHRPTLDQLNYAKTLLELLLLLLAIPWILVRFVRNPGGASRAAGRHHLS